MDDLIQENDELKRRLKEMTAEAANNETIMKRTQARELTLLRTESVAQLLRAMVDGLRESYSLDAVSVVLLDPQHEIRHLLLASGDRPEEFKQILFVDSLIGLSPQLTALQKPWLGPFVGSDHHLLFSQHVKSQKCSFDTATAQRPRHRCIVFWQLRCDAFYASSWNGFSCALGCRGRGLCRKRREPCTPVTGRHHRFSDGLA